MWPLKDANGRISTCQVSALSCSTRCSVRVTSPTQISTLTPWLFSTTTSSQRSLTASSLWQRPHAGCASSTRGTTMTAKAWMHICHKITDRYRICRFSQLQVHVDACKLLPPQQSAYRRGHSTETALVKVYSDLVRALDDGHQAVLALLDMTAAAQKRGTACQSTSGHLTPSLLSRTVSRHIYFNCHTASRSTRCTRQTDRRHRSETHPLSRHLWPFDLESCVRVDRRPCSVTHAMLRRLTSRRCIIIIIIIIYPTTVLNERMWHFRGQNILWPYYIFSWRLRPSTHRIYSPIPASRTSLQKSSTSSITFWVFELSSPGAGKKNRGFY